MALQPPGDIADINNLSATQLRASIQDLESRMARRRRDSKVSTYVGRWNRLLYIYWTNFLGLRLRLVN